LICKKEPSTSKEESSISKEEIVEELEYNDYAYKYLLAKARKFNYCSYQIFFNALESFVDSEVIWHVSTIKKSKD